MLLGNVHSISAPIPSPLIVELHPIVPWRQLVMRSSCLRHTAQDFPSFPYDIAEECGS
jgi:hypothetical protein